MTLAEELTADLKSELSITDPEFNEDLLKIKVNLAIKKVISARKYPGGYSETKINADLKQFYSNMRDIAHYYYNKVGADFEQEYTSNEIRRTFVNESKLFKGITPFSKL